MTTRPKLTKAVPTERVRLADWSGFKDYGGEAEAYAPAGEADICSVVRYCEAQGRKLRVVGLRTSWNSLWYSADDMMTTNHLTAIKKIDAANHTVTCEPGVTLTELHKALWKNGLTLNTAPAVDWVTVGGAISTGSHGSGPASISSSLVGCRLVTAAGDVVEINENDERLDAVRISLGMLGVLSEVTLKVVDAFHVSLKRTRIANAEWKRYLSEGEMSYLLWFAHTENSVLARVDIRPGPPEPPKPTGAPPAGPPMTLDLVTKYIGPVNELANIVPSTFPARNRYVLDAFFPEGEMAGPAHEILMSFRTPGLIAGAEWSVPVRRFDAAMADLEREMANGLWLSAPVWLKKVEPETAWLSAADEECVQCGIYHSIIPGTPSHVKEMVSRVERLMLGHGGRPHLGKLIYLEPAQLKSVYPNWDKFNSLRRRMDPSHVFWTKQMEERFGD